MRPHATMRAFRRRRSLFVAAVTLGCFQLHWPLTNERSEGAASNKRRGDREDGNAHRDADYEVATTNYGWNTPSGHRFARHITSGEFFNATLAHPRYNASAWADLEANPDPSRRIIAFMDVETCFDTNYPVYCALNWRKVSVEAGHPARYSSLSDAAAAQCGYLKRASESPALTSNPESRLVILDCLPKNRYHLRKLCQRSFESNQVVVAYRSASRQWLRPRLDVGIPPQALRPANLNATERDAVRSCQKRKYLFSFQGRGGFGRDQLLTLQNNTEFYIRISPRDFGPVIPVDGYSNDAVEDLNKFKSNDYRGIMVDSVFAGAPRGDVLFSFRFSEALSAGAVPVVYADGYLTPFGDDLVNWTECAVFIPESDYGKTGDILRAIPEEKRCEMQRCALEVWDRYAATRAGWVRGLVEVALSTKDINRTLRSTR